MQILSSAENEKLVRMALKEPVVFKEGPEEVAFMLSKHDYYRMKRQAADSFQRLCDEIGGRAKTRGLTEEKLNRLLSDES